MDSLAQFGYSNNQQDGVSRIVETITPHAIEKWVWGEIRDAAIEILHASAPQDRADAYAQHNAIAGYLRYCHLVAGVDLTMPGVLNPELIDRYVDQTRADAQPNTRRRLAQRLNRIRANALHLTAPETRHSGRRPAAFVADAAELLRAKDWADSLPNHRLRHNANVVVCLAAGAGLLTSEIETARLRDFATVDGVLTITVGGRVVPVRHEWRARLEQRLRPRGDDDLLLQSEQQIDSTTHAMAIFTRHARCPRPMRLRANYIVTLLNAAVPLPEILRVTGLEHTASLQRYLPYVTAPPNITAVIAGTAVD